MRLHQRELEMKEQYKREDKTIRTCQKLKDQVNKAGSDHEKLMKQLLMIVKEKEELVADLDKTKEEADKAFALSRTLEYSVASCSGRVRDCEFVLNEVAKAVPSDAISALIVEMQKTLALSYELQEAITNEEAQLADSESELKKYARDDCGLSQKVINLRKDVDKARRNVRTMQEQRSEVLVKFDALLKEMTCCEAYEKRRHEVALETEKSLQEAREQREEMRREVHLAEARRRDAELVCYGLQQQVQLLERELTGLRQQVAQGNFTLGNTLGAAFGRLAEGKSVTTGAAYTEDYQSALNSNMQYVMGSD